MKIILFIGLFIFLLSLIYSVETAPTCKQLKKQTFYSYEDAKDCMESVPLNKDIKESTLVSIEKTLPLYVFKDRCNVDWDSEIRTIRNKQHANEIDFYRDLFYLFQGLADAHTFYYVPGPGKCYRVFNFIQPFIPISYYSEQTKENKIEIYQIRKGFSESIPDAYQRLHGLQIDQYAGCFIQKIDGLDVTKWYVDNLDRQVAASKDMNIRFNMAIDKYLMHRPQDRFTAPPKAMTYELKCPNVENPVTVTVPWIAYTSIDVNSSDELTNSCQSKAQQAGMTNSKLLFTPEEMYDQEKLQKPFENGKKMMAYKNAENTLEEILTGDKVHFYIGTTPTDKFAVLKLEDFMPDSNYNFSRTIALGALEARKQKITKIIIDLFGNGGGEECLGYAMVKFLKTGQFKDNYKNNLFARSDMKYTPLGSKLATKAAGIPIEENLWNPNHWRNIEGKVFTDASWYNKPEIRGKGKATQLIKENYCDKFFQWFDFENPEVIDYKFDDIILLSDGKCASTCALFSSHVQQTHIAKTVSVGGMPNNDKPFSVNYIPGGQVYEFDELMSDVRDYGLLTDADAPPLLKTDARFRFAIRGAYRYDFKNIDEIKTLEYDFDPADFKIPFSRDSAIRHENLYFEVFQNKKLFDTCAPRSSVFCNIDDQNEHAVFEKNCVNGKYSEECTISRCTAGFEYNSSTKKCQACAAGFYKSPKSVFPDNYHVNVNFGMEDKCVPCQNELPNENAVYLTYSDNLKMPISNSYCPWGCVEGYVRRNDKCESEFFDYLIYVLVLSLLIIFTVFIISIFVGVIIGCTSSQVAMTILFKKSKEKYEQIQ